MKFEIYTLIFLQGIKVNPFEQVFLDCCHAFFSFFVKESQFQIFPFRGIRVQGANSFGWVLEQIKAQHYFQGQPFISPETKTQRSIYQVCKFVVVLSAKKFLVKAVGENIRPASHFKWLNTISSKMDSSTKNLIFPLILPYECLTV